MKKSLSNGLTLSGIRNETTPAKSANDATNRHKPTADRFKPDCVHGQPEHAPSATNPTDYSQPADATRHRRRHATNAYTHTTGRDLERANRTRSFYTARSNSPTSRTDAGHRTSGSAEPAASEAAIARASPRIGSIRTAASSAGATGPEAGTEAGHVAFTCAIGAVSIALSRAAVPAPSPDVTDAIASAFSAVAVASHRAISPASFDSVAAAAVATPLPAVADACAAN